MYMGISQFMAKEIMKELGNKSREFYEFILPPVDIVEGANDLVVTIDLPGFAKKDIKLRIVGNVLSVSAKRDDVVSEGTVYYKHRPNHWAGHSPASANALEQRLGLVAADPKAVGGQETLW